MLLCGSPPSVQFSDRDRGEALYSETARMLSTRDVTD